MLDLSSSGKKIISKSINNMFLSFIKDKKNKSQYGTHNLQFTCILHVMVLKSLALNLLHSRFKDATK